MFGFVHPTNPDDVEEYTFYSPVVMVYDVVILSIYCLRTCDVYVSFKETLLSTWCRGLIRVPNVVTITDHQTGTTRHRRNVSITKGVNVYHYIVHTVILIRGSW